MATSAVLLDLDNTLVLTDAIEALRRRRAWPEVYRRLALTELPAGTDIFLREAATLASLGVVTTSPRPYAERLLEHHGLSIPVLVAYHDTRRHKPDPEPLLAAAARLGVPVERCLHVGDTESDDLAAARAGMPSLRVSWKARASTAVDGWTPVLAAVRVLSADA